MTLEMATAITQQWQTGRPVPIDEALFAIQNPKMYIGLSTKEEFKKIKEQIAIWQNKFDGPKKPMSAMPKTP